MIFSIAFHLDAASFSGLQKKQSRFQQIVWLLQKLFYCCWKTNKLYTSFEKWVKIIDFVELKSMQI